MAKTLEELRADLARAVGKFFTGVATGGSTGTIVDTNGLRAFPEDDSLNGALAYIRTDAGGAHAAPEGQSKTITDHVSSPFTLTLESVLTAAVGVGDVYEVYRTPLSIAQWNRAINQAIAGAWPEVWRPEVIDLTFGAAADKLALSGGSADVWDVVRMWVQVTPLSTRWQEVPRSMWSYDAEKATIHLRQKMAVNTLARVSIKDKYPELAALASTTLDYDYILAAAQGNLYGTLAESTGGSDASRYLTLMSHWQDVAAKRKAALVRELEGAPMSGSVKK
jgi:hypothetical protein